MHIHFHVVIDEVLVKTDMHLPKTFNLNRPACKSTRLLAHKKFPFPTYPHTPALITNKVSVSVKNQLFPIYRNHLAIGYIQVYLQIGVVAGFPPLAGKKAQLPSNFTPQWHRYSPKIQTAMSSSECTVNE